MVLTARRGQFFIIGALLIAALITGYIILDVGGIQTPQTQTPRQLFDRAMNEFSEAVNHATAADPSADGMQRRLTSYLAFQRHLFSSHGVTARMHAVASVPDGDNVTVLLANFHRRNASDVRVTVDGTTKTPGTVTDGETLSLTFADVPRSIDVRTAFRAGRRFNQSFRTSSSRRSALLHLRLQGQDQTWVDTRVH